MNRARQHVDRISAHDAAQAAKRFEERVAEQGLSDLATRHPSAVRLIVATPQERAAMEVQRNADQTSPDDAIYGWTEFWQFARAHNISDRGELDRALGRPSSGMSPAQARNALRQFV